MAQPQPRVHARAKPASGIAHGAKARSQKRPHSVKAKPVPHVADKKRPRVKAQPPALAVEAQPVTPPEVETDEAQPVTPPEVETDEAQPVTPREVPTDEVQPDAPNERPTDEALSIVDINNVPSQEEAVKERRAKIAKEILASLPTIREAVANSELAADKAKLATDEAVELGARVVLRAMWVKYCYLRLQPLGDVVAIIKDVTEGAVSLMPPKGRKPDCPFELMILRLAYNNARHAKSQLAKMSKAFAVAAKLGTEPTVEAWTNLIDSTPLGYQALAKLWSADPKKGGSSESTEDDEGNDADADELEKFAAAQKPDSGVYELEAISADSFKEHHYAAGLVTCVIRLTERRKLVVMGVVAEGKLDTLKRVREFRRYG